MPLVAALGLACPWRTPSTDSTGESRSITGSPSRLLDGDEERVALLATVVHHDVDSRVLLLEPGGAGLRQRAVRVVRRRRRA